MGIMEEATEGTHIHGKRKGKPFKLSTHINEHLGC